jgi:hypothetical protein
LWLDIVEKFEKKKLHSMKHGTVDLIINYLYPTTKKTSLLRDPPGDKFFIYVPIRRYGDFNTLQWSVYPSAAPQDVLGYFRVLKSPYLRIGT